MTLPELERVPCSMCGGGEFRLLLGGCTDRLLRLPGSFNVQRCTSCGLVQTTPRPTPAALATYYPDRYATMFETSPGPPHRLRHLLRRLLEQAIGLPSHESALPPRAEPGAAWLELGCGTGGRLPALQSAGWEVWGVEPARRAAQQARQALEGTGTIVESAAEDAQLPTGHFQRIEAMHVVEHLRDPLMVLRRAREWIAADGMLVLECPNFASWERRVFRRAWFGLDLPRHLYHFTPVSLPGMLELAGWRVLAVEAGDVALLTATIVAILDDLRGGGGDWAAHGRIAGPMEVVEHLARLVGSKSTIRVLAAPA